jgi:LacI family transcriptional regulator
MVQVSHSGRDPQQELTRINNLVVQNVAAIVIAGSGYVDAAQESRARDVLRAYRQRGGRVAVIGRHHLGVDAVLPDNVAAGAAAARHLVELGHREILVAAGPKEFTTIADRLSGIRSVFEPLRIRPTVWHDMFSLEGGVRIASRIDELHSRPTAVLALSDVVAIGVLQEFRRRRIRVPDDVSVMGIDDIAVAKSLAPALTTVGLPLAEMGQAALSMVRKPSAAKPRRRIVPARLVVRESTARV